MRAAIRRLLGIALTLIAVSVGVFWTGATFDRRSVRSSRAAVTLPLFFNAQPVGVRQLAAGAVRSIARGDQNVEPARRLLARLGGSALPYVLPALDSLEPRSRERVALALTPIAVRMEVARSEELLDGALAVLFWTRFWQDRAIDFRVQSVRHLTRRLGQRSIDLRRDDLIHVDTFALEYLIQGLGSVNTNEDVARVQRLDSVLAHITEQPIVSGPGSGLPEAQRAVDRWRDFWELHGSEYTELEGARRLAATFAETRYGKWLGTLLRGGLGRAQTGGSALSVVERGLAVTFFLLFVGLGLGFPLGVIWSRFERQAGHSARRSASALAGTAIAAVPCATVVRVCTGLHPGMLTAVGLVTLTTAAWVSRHLARSTMPQNASPLSAAFSVSAPLGATYPPFVLSAIVVVELAFELPGVGRSAALSLASGDVNTWMACSLTLALATLLLRHAADLVRPRSAAAEEASIR